MFLKYIIVTSNPYVHTQFTTHGGVNYSMELSAILKLVFVATHLVCITSSNSIVQDFLSLADVWQNNIDTNVEAGQIHKRQAGDSCSKSSVTSVHDDGTFVIDIRFPHAEISHDDDYLCTSMSVPNPEEESYITKFIPEVSSKHAHHMLLYGCEEPYSDNPIWPCMMSGKCRDGSPAILYAWARDAAPLSLPPDVGYRIGGSGIKSLVLQIHFAHKMSPGKFSCAGMSLEAATKQPKYFSGIYLLGSGVIAIPPHGSSSATASCVNKVKPTLNVFAFRTHAHNLGTVITAYRVRDGVTKMIGKGNPLWPQAFYSRVGGSVDIRDDDILLARCDYKSDRDRWTSAGEGGGDEMCKFYMMYYTDNKQVASTALACWNNHLGHNLLVRWDAGELAPFPGYAGADSIKAIESGRASQPRVPHTHLDQHIHTNREQLDDRELFEEDQLLADTSPQSDAVQVVDEDAQERPAVASCGGEAWPDSSVVLGQVGGVAVDGLGRVHVFHRAYREWESDSFDAQNRFQLPNSPIHDDTVVAISALTGFATFKWGRDMFFMPHGITVVGPHLWLTDVALHQVMKFPLGGASDTLLTLGERMVPGDDRTHFCKPADVAVDAQGNVYVADGYCNGRVVKFDSNGTYLMAWGKPSSTFAGSGTPPPGTFFVVHSIAISPEDGHVCVADRELGRVQCFDTGGRFRRLIADRRRIGSNVYAIAFGTNSTGRLYAVNGPSPPERVTWGITIDYRGDLNASVVGHWRPDPPLTLTSPHDLDTSPDARQIYVGQLQDKAKLLRFCVGEEMVLSAALHADDWVAPQVAKLATGRRSRVAGMSLIIVLVALPLIFFAATVVILRTRARRLSEYEGLLKDDGYEHYHDQKQPFFKRPPLDIGALLDGGPAPRRDKKDFARVPTSEPLGNDATSDSEDELYSRKRDY